MKKSLSITICILLSIILVACGSSTKQTKKDTSTDSQTKKTEDTKKYVSKEYRGLSFEYPSTSEYTEAEDSATIIFEAHKKFVTIIPTDTSTLNKDLSDSWNDISTTSILGGFEDVQNQKDSDTTVSDMPAKCTTALVKFSNSWYSYSIIAVVNKDKTQQYSICYTTSEGASTDNSVYESFIESITL